MKTFASLFTGGGGADLGAIAAGLKPIWGIENNPDIARIGHRNIVTKSTGYRTLINDVKTVLWGSEERPDWLHASPPCIHASQANNGKETQEDIELARAVCRAIEVLQPEYFSLENVAGYYSFQSYKLICDSLQKLDYWISVNCIDAYDFGVPQNRKRLFLVAKLSGSIGNPLSSIPKVEKKVSWYDAIADLILSLKPTTLTEWQKEAIKWSDKKTSKNLAIQRSGARKKDGIANNTIRLADEPMFTIRAMSGNVRPSVNQVTLIIDGQPYEADIRCLARLQTFPDSYQWSEDKKLNVKIAGNAVPPLMFQKIVEAVLKA